MNLAKHLETLGLSPHKKYGPEEIKKAWKEKCKEHHPDKHQGSEDQEEHEKRFLEATHAYKMITDPSYRATRQLEDRKKNGNPHLDLHIRMQIPISFEEAFFGTDFALAFNRVEIDENHKPLVKEEQEVIALKINIPAGSVTGHDYVATGKGLKKGDKSGNCIIQFRPNEHPRFKIKQDREYRDKLHVQTTEQIPLATLLRGGKVEVQTMYGLKTLKVPPGTEPGTLLKIPKCGVQEKGDHYIIAQTQFPKQDDLKKDEAWKGLDINWDVQEEIDKEEEALREEERRLREKHGNPQGAIGYALRFTSTTGGF